MAGTMVWNGSKSKSPECLNGVRPRWPEQSETANDMMLAVIVSMESGLDGRNNASNV